MFLVLTIKHPQKHSVSDFDILLLFECFSFILCGFLLWFNLITQKSLLQMVRFRKIGILPKGCKARRKKGGKNVNSLFFYLTLFPLFFFPQFSPPWDSQDLNPSLSVALLSANKPLYLFKWKIYQLCKVLASTGHYELVVFLRTWHIFHPWTNPFSSDIDYHCTKISIDYSDCKLSNSHNWSALVLNLAELS